MISIVLTVLKVIGWLLLILLLLLLTVIFALLFVSVKYRIAFENEDHIQLRLTTRWLFPFFYLKGAYQTGETEGENPQFQMYLLGFRIAPKNKKAKEKVKSDRDGSTDDASEISEPQLVAMEQSSTKKTDERENTTESDTKSDTKSDIKAESEAGCDPTNKEPHSSDEKKKAHTTKEQGSQKRKSELFALLREKYTSMKSMINDEGNRRAMRLLWAETKYLLKHYGPRTMRGHLEYATGDPANTGLVTGALSLCPFVYGKKMEVIPDFESEIFYIRGNACLIGHIRLVHLLKSIIVLFFDKDIRRIAHQLKK